MNSFGTRSRDEHSEGVFCSVEELFFEGRKAHSGNLHLRRHAVATQAGAKRSSIRGRGMEFFESRPYVAQDEMRMIDWKVTARLNELFTKVFIEERDRPIYLGIDLRHSMFFGSRVCFKSVLAARISARLATAAVNGGDHVGGMIFTDVSEMECPVLAGRKNLARLFGALAAQTKQSAERDGQKSWHAMLKRMVNRVHRGASVFLVSDFVDLSQECRPVLFKLRKKADVFAIRITDPLERKLPDLGVVGMAYGDEHVQFDSSDRAMQKKYLIRRKEHNDALSSMLSLLNIPMIEFSTAENPDFNMKRIFSGRW